MAGIRPAPAGARVGDVDATPGGLALESVRPPALDVDDEADAAGVVLAARVVQPLGGRRTGNGGSGLNFRPGVYPFFGNSFPLWNGIHIIWHSHKDGWWVSTGVLINTCSLR